ncbi:Protein of unknown function [Seinonella peptonophila]|uniref:DUF3055 domain-containing protein n=1 Tax=Seinonella peptonophila TaxID=112248 RepID=A0A1M4V1R1_9BACL|nr:DUF3055 domain-containing protein [Seinonella peptonophila]SHE62842.1 Protein of unknown function [Seinonella peptonophila]
MSNIERLYDEAENAQVRFVGFVSGNQRYDYGIVYTNLFFGKPLVVCMQTGRSSLFSLEDVDNLEYIQQVFNLRSLEEAQQLALFFRHNLPAQSIESETEM